MIGVYASQSCYFPLGHFTAVCVLSFLAFPLLLYKKTPSLSNFATFCIYPHLFPTSVLPISIPCSHLHFSFFCSSFHSSFWMFPFLCDHPMSPLIRFSLHLILIHIWEHVMWFDPDLRLHLATWWLHLLLITGRGIPCISDASCQAVHRHDWMSISLQQWMTIWPLDYHLAVSTSFL